MKFKLFVVTMMVVSSLVTGTMVAMAEETPTEVIQNEMVQSEEYAEVEQLIDINLASLEQLISLPGIGQVLAQRIVEGRPYEAVEDLMDVSGIAEKRFGAIKNSIVVVIVGEESPAEEPAQEEAQ